MTEQEAKTKWCPMVRATLNVAPHLSYAELDGTKARNPEQARCIGMECMMWKRKTYFWIAMATMGIPEEHGDCGLKDRS